LPSRRPIRCFQRISGTPLVRYCCVVCVPSPESAFLKHALSSQTHKDCIVSSLYSLVVRYRLQQSSLTLPVFTNWPRFRSSAPDRRVFVLKTLCNTIAIGKDCTELHCTALHCAGTAEHDPRAETRYPRTPLRQCKIVLLALYQRHRDLPAAGTPLARQRQTHPFEAPPKKPINHLQPCTARRESIFLCSLITTTSR
jgi:hypothetical protein